MRGYKRTCRKHCPAGPFVFVQGVSALNVRRGIRWNYTRLTDIVMQSDHCVKEYSGAVPLKKGASKSLSVAEKTGIAAFVLAGVLCVFWGPLWSILSLAGFIVVCLAAPFATRFGFFLPVVCRGSRKKAWVSLTFDDGPDSLTTPLILDILQSYRMPGHLFCHRKKCPQPSGSHCPDSGPGPHHRQSYLFT